MDIASVKIHVVALNSNGNPTGIAASLASLLSGAAFSSLDEIKVNKIGSDYSVIYSDELFQKLDTSAFAENLINILASNLPDANFNISLHYWACNNEELFSPECGVAVIHLNNYLDDYEDERVLYTTSGSAEYLVDCYDEDTEEFDFEPEVAGTIDQADDDDDEDDVNESSSILDQYLNNDRKMKSKSYGSSKVLKSLKNPKKYVKRHGIMVSNDKSAKKKDEKIIKSFLRDFIPGKSSWVREYREEVLDRWMGSYAISKKTLQKLEKAHSKQHGKSHKNGSNITKETAMNLTRKFFSKDSWNDPNR